VQECLQYLGVQTDHISVRTSYRGISSYRQMVSHAESIRVHGLRYLFESMNAEDNLLIVDDVYSSGLNVNAILERLHYKMRKNMPQDIRIAVPWYRPDKSGPNRSGPDINKSVRIPDYYIHQTDQWLVLPYELNGLTRAEIRQHKGLGQLMDDLQEFLPDQSLQ